MSKGDYVDKLRVTFLGTGLFTDRETAFDFDNYTASGFPPRMTEELIGDLRKFLAKTNKRWVIRARQDPENPKKLTFYAGWFGDRTDLAELNTDLGSGCTLVEFKQGLKPPYESCKGKQFMDYARSKYGLSGK
jgi:hypothetical protein